MKPILTVALLFLLTGCATRAISQSAPPTPTILTGDTGDTTRRLTLTLTLSHPSDLRVKEGDRLKSGDIVSDRVRDRERLTVQKQQLQLQLDRLKQPVPVPPAVRPVPELAGLPPASFLDEVATVERQRLGVVEAENRLNDQQRLLDMLSAMPTAEIPEAVIPHEQAVFRQRQDALDQARADLELARAELAQAQAERQFEEYQHSVTVANRQLQIQQNELQRQDQAQRQHAAERDRAFQLAQLEAQMNALDMQLLSLSTVRSPFDGQITRIKWTGQNDQSLVVELVLVADDGRGSAADPSSPGGRSTVPR